MIKLISAHIEEFRGIRKLDLRFNRENLSIWGPNGSGKSGVIDAIEFGLTGHIARLSGSGTKGLSVTEHGPHVDKSKFPDAAFVELEVFLTDIGKTARIRRYIKKPRDPQIDPHDADVIASLNEVAEHPEIALSRRDIIRFILVEPSKRSQEIQALLKLDQIDTTRQTLNTAHRRGQRTVLDAGNAVSSARSQLLLHLQLASLDEGSLLENVNVRRRVVGLPAIDTLTAETALDAGLTAAPPPPTLDKPSALRDIDALAQARASVPQNHSARVAAMLEAVARLDAEPALATALKQQTLIDSGLALVDADECPLCDTEWNANALRAHLRAKRERSAEARQLQHTLLNGGTALASALASFSARITAVRRVAESVHDNSALDTFTLWQSDLDTFRSALTTVDGIVDQRDRVAGDWLATPQTLDGEVTSLRQRIATVPDQTATIEAQTFLSTAQIRFRDYQATRRAEARAKKALAAAKAAYDAYCQVVDTELGKLYDQVRDEFSEYYRAINKADEGRFTAKLIPSESRLDLTVDFYDRGLFPPGAYHSEGHQDGMGVCLYLALMSHLFGARFGLALLDDVVMSVDTDHRYEFCRLLRSKFPNTQFILTTHDRVWADQMRSAGLVSSRASLAFHAWSIDTGPLVESDVQIWDEIDAALKANKVSVAAATLRHHVEYVARVLADQLGAIVPFRADGAYELGDLFPAVLTSLKKLYGKGADAAQSWGQDEVKREIGETKERLSNASAAQNVEQWAVNKAVHYNAWANFSRNDFVPVVKAYRELLDQFRCATCEAWLFVSPRRSPDTLRCACNAMSINLKSKPKG